MGNGGKDKRTTYINCFFYGDLTQGCKHKLNKNVDLKEMYDYCTNIISTSNTVAAIRERPFPSPSLSLSQNLYTFSDNIIWLLWEATTYSVQVSFTQLFFNKQELVY